MCWRGGLGSVYAFLVSAAMATNEQDEANHVADDERRTYENGDVPLGGQMRDGPCGRRMRKRDEGVERAD